jgi:hypothetical protein
MSTDGWRPYRVTPTRVYRFYRGWALIDCMRGLSEEDGHFPEDWMASVTPAANPGRREPEEGSRVSSTGASCATGSRQIRSGGSGRRTWSVSA